MDCIFCSIAAGRIPSDILHQDEKVVAFRDVNPQAPVHLLVIPRKHISQLSELTEEDTPLIGHMIEVANQQAKREGIAESGYRLVINSGKEGGQLVPTSTSTCWVSGNCPADLASWQPIFSKTKR